MNNISDIAEVMRLVAEDCAADAKKVDKTPFTPAGIGEIFGGMLAMIAAVAKANALLADEIERRNT